MSIVKPNCFEKTKEAWGIFFSSTNVETKNVCPIAYNVPCVCCRFNATYTMLAVCIFNFLAWDF